MLASFGKPYAHTFLVLEEAETDAVSGWLCRSEKGATVSSFLLLCTTVIPIFNNYVIAKIKHTD